MASRTLLASAVLLALSTCLVSGCGGGSSTGMVRTETLPPLPPPPPPSSAPAEPCPSPVTADCTVDATYTLTWNEGTQMTGGRQSDHALTVKGTGWLNLKGDNRFSGGTTIVEDATLVVWDSLTSDVHITAPGTQGSGSPTLWLGGTLNGNVINDNIVSLAHLCGTGVNACVEDHHPVVNGGFQQSHAAVLDVVLGWDLQISGKAALDGKLGLLRGTSQSYVLPSAPASILVLHAGGGVSGQFVSWTSPGLFLTGSLRYLPNDIYFDATSVSVATAMAAARAGDALTLQSAKNFDAALGNAGKWASQPGAAFTTTQRQFLASVGAVQRLQDYGQATRTFDSLSGRGHMAAADALLLQASLPAADLMSRMDQLHDGSRLGAWSGQATTLAPANGTFNVARAGFDQWLGDRLALGVSIGAGDGILRFDGVDGTARDRAPQWDVYLQRLVGADAYVFGDIGYGHHQLDTQRAIDLGTGQFQVRGMRDLNLVRAYLETGRHFHTAAGELTWFGALSHAMLQGAGFVEQGVTGFELIAQPSTQQRTSALTGLRLGQAWRNGNRVTTLSLAAGYSRILHAQDDSRAAFTGTPDTSFALGALPESRGSGWMQLDLGTGNEHWNVGVNYDRQASNQAVVLHTRLAF